MPQTYPVMIRTTLWDSGCLPAILRREIAVIERSMSLPGGLDHSEYLAQLRAVLNSVEVARGGTGSAR